MQELTTPYPHTNTTTPSSRIPTQTQTCPYTCKLKPMHAKTNPTIPPLPPSPPAPHTYKQTHTHTKTHSLAPTHTCRLPHELWELPLQQTHTNTHSHLPTSKQTHTDIHTHTPAGCHRSCGSYPFSKHTQTPTPTFPPPRKHTYTPLQVATGAVRATPSVNTHNHPLPPSHPQANTHRHTYTHTCRLPQEL